ncbi:uncharacterized protein LOC122236213 isoform X3 [Panthera tigris]|uniref:uncharacterized protein LOC122236213 isoform X3 n=1 Tax=Panthera tigris TaxID=9694 RepID=UPI001C6F951A|nr:uncharacterized protein LOC122236213 isoform X3 [Panthera tigris]
MPAPKTCWGTCDAHCEARGERARVGGVAADLDCRGGSAGAAGGGTTSLAPVPARRRRCPRSRRKLSRASFYPSFFSTDIARGPESPSGNLGAHVLPPSPPPQAYTRGRGSQNPLTRVVKPRARITFSPFCLYSHPGLMRRVASSDRFLRDIAWTKHGRCVGGAEYNLVGKRHRMVLTGFPSLACHSKRKQTNRPP